MPRTPIDYGESQQWPYVDLPLKTPHCPWCGSPGVGLVGLWIHPIFFCKDDDCPALSWDPSLAALELLRSVGELEERDSG